MMPDGHVRDLLSPYLDGEASPAESQRVTSHLATCQACEAELADLRRVRDLVRALPDRPIPRSFTLGPRALPRPHALARTPGGILRAVGSVAAAIVFLVLAGNLVFAGLPRQASVAAPAAVRAASPFSTAASVAPAAQPAAAAAAPARAPANAQAGRAAPAGISAPQTEGAPRAAQAPVEATRGSTSTTATPGPGAIDTPLLAAEAALLAVSLVFAVYSVRWWRR